MESDWAAWLGIILRFVHVLAAIMWIGDSLLFTWMEFHLIKPSGQDPDTSKLGSLDMLHGGGVYHLEKRVLKAGGIPSPLHWFMWQSYTTWLAGFALLLTLYHSGSGSSFLDSTKTTLPGWAAVLLSLTGLFGGWLIYDGLWRSPLRKQPWLALLLCLLALFTAAALYNQVFNGRAVYLQIGAMMGTLMTANVFFRIIPNQRKFLAALEAGQPHDLELGKQAKSRSLQNHYMTFPVLFLMLSAHFPQLTGADWNIPILVVLVLSLMLIKFLMNARHHFHDWLPCLGGTFLFSCVAIFIFLALPGALHPSATPGQIQIAAGKQLFLGKGCAACHMQGGNALAPDLHGVFGTIQQLADGTEVRADESYLRDSIRTPGARIVKGYAPAMPSYDGQLTDSQIASLVAYIRSLAVNPGQTR